MLATINMGSAVYGTPVPAQQHAVHHEPQSALRDGGRNDERTLPFVVRFRRSTSARLASRPAARLRRPCAQSPRRRGAWPQFRGNPRLTGVTDDAPPATLKLLWKYEVGESIDSSAAIADGAVYVGALDRRSGGDRPRDRQAALEVHGGESDRRVVAGGQRRHGIRRRRRRHPPRRAGEGRQPAVDVQDAAARSSRRRSSSSGRADRIVRRLSLCARRRDRKA